MKIHFLVPYPIKQAPSQRFRFEQYFSSLQMAGHTYTFSPFLSAKNWKVFYSTGKSFERVITISSGFIQRIQDLFHIRSCDFVFIHREASPVGPPFIEWIIAKVLRKKIIYDFDDAIWLTDKTDESALEKILRWRSKVGTICRLSYKVSCGNDYLAKYARQFNSNVLINPTTIDTEGVHYRDRYPETSPYNRSGSGNEESVVIGWTGSHSTLKYLEMIGTVLEALEKKYNNLSFLVIADKEPRLSLKRMKFRKWSKETEVADLIAIDIGIMPLPDDEWTKGKCGFKALQYMSLGIPAVASPIGVNTTIIEHGVNGYLANTEMEWMEVLSILIEKKELREELGEKAMETVRRDYSVTSNQERFLSLFS